MSNQTVPEFRLLYPDWQPEYTKALLELDPSKLPDLLRAAEAAISKRLEFLAGEPNDQEGQALKDALHTVEVLKDNGCFVTLGEAHVGVKAATSPDEVLAICDGESDLGDPFLPATLQLRVD